MMFISLPLGFPQLEAFTRQASGGIPPPPDLSSMGERVYRACVNRSLSELPDLRSSIKRKIPYAMWLDRNRDIHTTRHVVNWYYENLEGLEVDSTTRTKRLLAPMFHTYVAKFNRESRDFQYLAENLQSLAKQCGAQGSTVLRLSELQDRFDFFQPDRVGTSVAKAFLASANDTWSVDRWFESIGLWAGFKSSTLGIEIYLGALRLPTETYRTKKNVDVLIRWTEGLGKILSSDTKARLASALLKPWVSEDPDPELKKQIGDFCVSTLGDPRFEGFAWTQVDENSRAVILRWLTGRTLDIFFDVLRHTADTIWRHRQDFWSDYYKRGYISEAWAVLGPDAHRYVRSKFQGADLSYGRLSGQYDEAQSVLMMRMGDLLFCEWSHNGKLRVAPMETKGLPTMYKKTFYDATELRFDSLPFRSHTGVDHFGLTHFQSESRGWQTTAARFIRSRLGI